MKFDVIVIEKMAVDSCLLCGCNFYRYDTKLLLLWSSFCFGKLCENGETFANSLLCLLCFAVI